MKEAKMKPWECQNRSHQMLTEDGREFPYWIEAKKAEWELEAAMEAQGAAMDALKCDQSAAAIKAARDAFEALKMRQRAYVAALEREAAAMEGDR